MGAGGVVRFNNGTSWSSQTSGTTNDLLGVFFRDSTTGWMVGDTIASPQQTSLTQDGGVNWITVSPQHVEFQFTAATASGAVVTSVQATLVHKTSAAPAAGVAFWILASADLGTTWKYYSIPAGSTSTKTAAVDLSSYVDSGSKVAGLRLRYYVEAGSTFTTSHDVVQVQVN